MEGEYPFCIKDLQLLGCESFFCPKKQLYYRKSERKLVQGEGMEKRRENRKWRTAGRFPAELLFLAGFLMGNILPNLIWKMEWRQKTLASFYLLRNFAGKSVSGGAYFAEVFRRRGVFFLLLFLCGYTIFGVPLSVAYMLLLGMETGVLLALSVLEFGLYGGIAGAGLLMPQYLIYLPAYFYLAGIVYRQSFDIGKNYGLVPQKSGKYFQQGLLAFLVYTGGILLESFLNPWIVEKVVKELKFF